MGQTTGISWTDATWNPIRGCSRVSSGCMECYAEKVAARFSGPGQPYEGLAKKVGGEARWTGEVRFIEEHLADPLKWRKPRRIFVNSMSDLFHEKLTDEQIDRVFAVMALAPRHTFQVLTKRPARMLTYMTGLADRGGSGRGFARLEASARGLGYTMRFNGMPLLSWPIPNVHLGVSVENQAAADERIPLLLQTPAAVRWIGAEPLLGPVDLRFLQPGDPPTEINALDGTHGVLRPHRGRCDPLDWVVVGGESGPDHRPMNLDWLRSIVEQCRAAHVPVWVKQDSGFRSGLQGAIPQDLWVQQFPAPGGDGKGEG